MEMDMHRACSCYQEGHDSRHGHTMDLVPCINTGHEKGWVKGIGYLGYGYGMSWVAEMECSYTNIRNTPILRSQHESLN